MALAIVIGSSPHVNQQCAYCYLKRDSVGCGILHCCDKCSKRLYCSQECQAADWNAGHQHWCGTAGEVDYDYEIRVSPGRGLGVFALRSFERNDRIMVERPVIIGPCAKSIAHRCNMINTAADSPFKASMKQAVWELTPLAVVPGSHNDLSCVLGATASQLEESMFEEKVSSNSMVMGSGMGLCIVMSRVNHSCLGNAANWFLGAHQVKVLSAAKNISIGEEITMSYTKIRSYEERQSRLLMSFRFKCTCPGCTDPLLRFALDRDYELDESLPGLMGKKSTVAAAISVAKQLLKRRQELGLIAQCYPICVQLFSLLVRQQDTVEEGQRYATQGAELREAAVGVCDEESTRMRQYAADPSRHCFYLRV